MFTCNDENINKIARSLIGHGIGTTTYERDNKIAWYREAISSGHNFRMSNIHAAIGFAQFKRLEEMNLNRIRSAKFYSELIENKNLPIEIPLISDKAEHVYQMYTVIVDSDIRNDLVKELNENGIGASVHFDPPVHKQEYYKNYEIRESLANTEFLSDSIVTLPMFSTITDKEISYVVNTLEKLLNSKN